VALSSALPLDVACHASHCWPAPCTHSATAYQLYNLRLTEDSTKFAVPCWSSLGCFLILAVEWTELYQISAGHRSIICTFELYLDFRFIAPF